MEKKIKALYILSICAIVGFLCMQAYWLYARCEYSLRESEDRAGAAIEKALDAYLEARAVMKTKPRGETKTAVQSSYNLNNDVDSLGRQKRTVSVSTLKFDARSMLGIPGDRKLTTDEQIKLGMMVADSIAKVERRKTTMDVSGAPSDAAAWAAMQNFETELVAPFTAEGLDSMLRKEHIEASIELVVADSIMWKPVSVRHKSIVNPRFVYESPYSELEKKNVRIVYAIPASAVVREMGITLVLAILVSVLLILCLVWQIRTIVRLTHLDKMRNMFITTMIHELKRPLSMLMMCVSGIENDKMLADSEMKAKLTKGARTALDNLSAYFSRLRDITFNNVEQIPLNITGFNLAGLVDDVVASASVPATKSVMFHNRVDRDMEVSADRTHMCNVLANLVENAIKYSGGSVYITIEAARRDGGVDILVADTGRGIAPRDINRIFSRFYRGAAAASDIPGMGLGLTYARLLTEAHGGCLGVSSEQGKGSVFTIYLPQ